MSDNPVKVYCLGNPLYDPDSAVPSIFDRLTREFPDLKFMMVDPSEDFTPDEGAVIIDTVAGIKNVGIYRDIGEFARTSTASVHDYDLITHLSLLKKLGRLGPITIIGLPAGKSSEEVFLQTKSAISFVLHAATVSVGSTSGTMA